MEGGRLEVLKGAIILERSGAALYAGLAAGASDPEVRRLFERLADEEQIHRAWLERVFVEAASEGSDMGFSAVLPAHDRVASAILTGEIVAGAASASFESAAVSAARALEERAVGYYAKGASDAADPGEAGFYRMLSEWEEVHLEVLARLEKSILEAAMRDESLWASIDGS